MKCFNLDKCVEDLRLKREQFSEKRVFSENQHCFYLENFTYKHWVTAL